MFIYVYCRTQKVRPNWQWLGQKISRKSWFLKIINIKVIQSCTIDSDHISYIYSYLDFSVESKEELRRSRKDIIPS
jgi:hypothetical protein